VERRKLDALRRRSIGKDWVVQCEHLGPFLEGTLWRTQGQEMTDVGKSMKSRPRTRKGIRGC